MSSAIVPHENDVLFGKGYNINNHNGNIYLRSLVSQHKKQYHKLTLNQRIEKRTIANYIIHHITNEIIPHGRFLIEDTTTAAAATTRGINNGGGSMKVHPTILQKVWKEVSYEKALDKVMHRLREKDTNATSNNGDFAVAAEANHVGSSSQLGLQPDNVASDQSTDDFDTLVERIVDPHDIGRQNYDGSFDTIRLQEQQMNRNGSFDNIVRLQEQQEEVHRQILATEQQIQEQTTLGMAAAVMHNQQQITPPQPLVPLVTAGHTGINIENHQQEEFVETTMYELDKQHENQLPKQTLKQWIQRMKVLLSNTHTTYYEYIKTAALPIAQMLIEYIIDSEVDEDIVPLKFIKIDRVLIVLQQEGTTDKSDFVWIQYGSSDSNSSPDDAVVGTVQSRLLAVGMILYELFSTEDETQMEGLITLLSRSSATSVMSSMNLNDDKPDNNNRQSRPQKRSYHPSSSQTPRDEVSIYITKLEEKGIPRSVCTVVKNLLDCSKGDYCGDDTYSSFVDLHQDLLLIIDNPSIYLDDIQTSTSLPTLTICNDKVYGREEEITQLTKSYQKYIEEKSYKGVIISGGAGVGKSRLAMYTQKLTSESNGHFCSAKFEQNEMNSKPLTTVGGVFNTLCEIYTKEASPNELELVGKELENRLGNQASLLAGVVPGLYKFLPTVEDGRGNPAEASGNCVNAEASMRYLFGELLKVMCLYSKRPISIFIDDIQFADSASLLLIGDLLFAAMSGASIFFVFCHRDDEESLNSTSFGIWLNSALSLFSMTSIQLGNMAAESVNTLVSETLHTLSRITRPLSTVLHHKTRGNPLFVKQLLGSLYGQGYIYVDLTLSRWAWNMEKIEQEPVSSSVIALLIKEMKGLPSSAQLGLGIASCLGSSVQKELLDILSKDLKVDLKNILKEVSSKGFMDSIDGGTKFRFAHDKIQQAAYELQSKEHRRQSHMRFGLTLCSHALNACHGHDESSELFFTAITQINKGGPTTVRDPSQMSVIAGLNLKAGRLSISLSGYTTAFMLFEHGISYLGNDKWTSNYDLSTELYDAVAEAACALNKRTALTTHVNELVDHAKTFDDCLHCLSMKAKALQNASLFKESLEMILDILTELGENPPRSMDDSTLKDDINAMNKVLRERSDDSILNMPQTNNKKIVTLHRLYSDLVHVLHFTKPDLVSSVSLRLMEISLKSGITPTAPISFSCYGEMLASSMKMIEEGCRLGRLAIKLVEKNISSSKYKPVVILGCNQTIFWYTKPLQAVAEAHFQGYTVGQQLGDFLYSTWNQFFFITTNYLAGQNLCTVQSACKDYVMKRLSEKQQNFIPVTILLHYQAIALRQGLHILDTGRVDDIPTEAELLGQKSTNLIIHMSLKMHKLVRALLFRQLNSKLLLEEINISESIVEKKIVLRPAICNGIFFEGLSCFLCSRGSNDTEKTKMIERGRSILTRARNLAEHSSWNWENKVQLLEAMEMHALGNLDEAEPLYTSSIRSAKEHKFIHEEAVASELTGDCLFERGLLSDAYALYKHSIKCFEEWGADAVAKRVDTDMQSKFGADISHLEAVDVSDILGSASSLDPQSTQKRNHTGGD